MTTTSSKPAYRVPLMSEVARIRWNGLKVASFFAGTGGSSLGYRMAGCRVVYANEFVPIAQESYKANAARWTHLDGRDVREVKGAEVLRRTGLKRGELDILDGSPPCQAFSMAGKREKGWGKVRKYEHGAEQKNEELFDEFVRLVAELEPKVFVAENVSGLVKGKAKGIFLEILRKLKAAGPGYDVEVRVLDAQWLGVPQQRVRVIFQGVRKDLARRGLKPCFPKPLPHRYSVREAIPWIVGGSNAAHGYTKGDELHPDKSAPTVNCSLGKGSYQGHQVHVVGNSNAAHSRKGEKRSIEVPARTVQARRANLEVQIVQGAQGNFKNKGKRIDETKSIPCVIANDASRRAPAQFEVQTKIVAGGRGSRRRRDSQKPYDLDLPGPTIMADGDRKNSGQIEIHTRVVHDTGRKNAPPRVITNRTCPTITAGPNDAGVGGGPRNHFLVEEKVVGVGGRGGFGNVEISSLDGPSATIGTDPSSGNGLNPSGSLYVQREGVTQKRKFTIDELKRLCSFPDDFTLEGTYAQQWERLGNSVPPVMMFHIARAIAEGVFKKRLPPPPVARTAAPRAGSSPRSTSGSRPKGGARPRGGRRKEASPSGAAPC